MDLSSLLLFGVMSIAIGAVLMLLLQYYVFIRFFNCTDESLTHDPQCEQFILPEKLMASIKDDPDSKNSVTGINLILQFLFQELRYSNKVRKWFHRKLSLELDELLTKTAIGKFFDKLMIRELDLGGQFPEIKNIRLNNADLHETEGYIESLDLVLDLNYSGNFRTSIDANLVLGKKGSLSIKVKHVSGLARLQFTRRPYTHWSLSFLGEPQMVFDIQSHLSGRQMQSNITNVISNQIRKAIKRKHTLPNYKLRYKPFFHKVEDDMDLSDIIMDGKLELNVLQLTRLMIPNHITHVYCTITLATYPWVQARQHDDQTIIMSLDIEIHKAKNQQIGIIFKQHQDDVVLIESVIPNTPAMKAELKPNDILISVEGRKVSHINQVAKILKNLNRPAFVIRIERKVAGLIKNDALLADDDLYEDINGSNVVYSKGTVKLTRRLSIERTTPVVPTTEKTSSDSSVANTPQTSSPRKLSDKSTKSKGKNLSRGNSETTETKTTNEPTGGGSIKPTVLAKAIKENALKQTQNNFINYTQQHSTYDCFANSFIHMNDVCTLCLNDNFNYLNINVYGRCNDDNLLLGYLNIPVNTVLAECAESNLGHFIKLYSLHPPDVPNMATHPLSAQSGFDGSLCYGDILISYVWSGMTSSTVSLSGSTAATKKSKVSKKDSVDKLDDDRSDSVKQHDFVRTHFNRSTLCDYCGRKIWLKDAVQCRDCSMCCHKKCISKCQANTICGPVEANISSYQHQFELKVTEPPTADNFMGDDTEEIKPRLESHRQSFSELLTQGLKRVNSANNLSIPGVTQPINTSSKSLPPSPQHISRKQSLASQNVNPFVVITKKLEQLPIDMNSISREDIAALTDPLIGSGTPEEIMSLAKTASRTLYVDLEAAERVKCINDLFTKLKIALDAETTSHTNLELALSEVQIKQRSNSTVEPPIRAADSNLLLQTKPPTFSITGTPKKSNSGDIEQDTAHKTYLIEQSEERVHALSIIMLYLCTGLQHAQGVAGI